MIVSVCCYHCHLLLCSLFLPLSVILQIFPFRYTVTHVHVFQYRIGHIDRIVFCHFIILDRQDVKRLCAILQELFFCNRCGSVRGGSARSWPLAHTNDNDALASFGWRECQHGLCLSEHAYGIVQRAMDIIIAESSIWQVYCNHQTQSRSRKYSRVSEVKLYE